MLAPALRSLIHIEHLPPSRQVAFRSELLAGVFWAITSGFINGNLAGYIVGKTFQGPDKLVAVVAAAVPFSHLVANVWSRQLAHHSARVVVLWAGGLASLCVAMVAFSAMLGHWAAWAYSACIILCCVGMNGQLITRTTMWRTIYPDRERTGVVARFTVLGVLVSAGWVYVVTQVMELTSEGVWQDIHIGPLQSSTVALAGMAIATSIAAIAAPLIYRLTPFRLTSQQFRQPTGPRTKGLLSLIAPTITVLRGDRRYREYMAWQMLSGALTMSINVPLVLILKDVFSEAGYVAAGSALVIVPQLAMVLTTPFWSRQYNRMTVLQYRTIQAPIFSLGTFLLAIGVVRQEMLWVLIGRAIMGVGFGAGGLVWRLGHMAFAKPHEDSNYFAVHLSLAGIRGIIMPFVGLYLYSIIGWHVIWAIGLGYIVTTVGFYTMSIRYPDLGHPGRSRDSTPNK